MNAEKRVCKQKQLLLCSLNEAYSLIKQQYPNEKVEFSKLCEISSSTITAAGHVVLIQYAYVAYIKV
jgi:hypothetical protein